MSNEGKALKEKLFNLKKSGWEKLSDEELSEIFKFADEYMYYLNSSKTEKEIVQNSKEILLKNGFVDVEEKENLQPGDKVFYVNHGRSLYVAVIGEEPLTNGMRVVAAHGDSPRIDLKQNPFYEDGELAMLKTHYYGGIKKYQWTNIPLAMHGTVVKPNGEKVEISIGEREEDPVFTISDLLPHLAGEQMERKLKDGVQGEELNILMGSIPYEDDTVSERVKLNVLNLLNEKYGITEVDFVSSEIEFVPAFKAKSLGLDYSMVGAYGQDDKVCCYTALRGILNVEHPRKTAVCILTDKEEVGFNGVTGMCTMIFETFIHELLDKKGENSPSALQKVFSKSKAISADVDAGYDPNYPSAFEKNNTSFMGKGLTVVKYTGARGKSGASEAPCELVAELRKIYENAGVRYQACELGKVDKGGGGTIALTLANRGMEVVDSGVPVVGMHSPYEITSKYDVYAAYKGYEAFYKA
ncbi:MAG: aminopeptidase [Clostridia bacterium]|nr:aminopeptidase [Clostridia bacterium]